MFVQKGLITVIYLVSLLCCVYGISKNECPDPKPTPNTYRLTNESSFQPGGEIKYGCFMNHIQTGGSKSLICSQGIFSNTPLQCKLNCGNPKMIPGAKYVDSGTRLFLPGETVTYTCTSDKAKMNATCDASLGGWKYGDFDCLEELIWDLEPTETSDNDIHTFHASIAQYPSWTREQKTDGDSTIYNVTFILGKETVSPASINVYITLIKGTVVSCGTIYGPFQNEKEYSLKCAEPTQGLKIQIIADYYTEDKYHYLFLSEVGILGINNAGDYNDCGSPPVLYGAESSTNTLQRGNVASYYCLYGYNFITKYNSPAQSTCLPNNTWSQLDNFCGRDEPSPEKIYPNGVECLLNPSGKEYKGKLNYTISGKSCLNWFGHPNVENWLFPDQISDEDNYCRNPEGNIKEKPWCFVDEYETTEYCPLVECNMICSMYEDNFDYIGNVYYDKEGDTCLNWQSETVSEQFSLFIPEAFPDNKRDHSYCRNPGRSQKTAWCFSKDNDTLEYKPCSIPRCHSVVPKVINVAEMGDMMYECQSVYYWEQYNPDPIFKPCHNVNITYMLNSWCKQHWSMHFFISRIFSSENQQLVESPNSWYWMKLDCDATTTTTTTTTTTQPSTTDPDVTQSSSSEWTSNNDLSSPSSSTSELRTTTEDKITPFSTENNKRSTTTSNSNLTSNKGGTTFTTTSNSKETTLTTASYNNETTLTTTSNNNEPTLTTTRTNYETTLTTTSTNNETTLTTTKNNYETTLTTTSTNNETTLTTTDPISNAVTESNAVSVTKAGTTQPSYSTSKQPNNDTTERSETSTSIEETTRSTTTSKFQHVCPCSCQKDKSIATVEKEMKKVQKELTVEKSTLSVNIRKQTSAVDNRPSAVSIGYVGIILLVVTLVLIIIPDMLGLLRYLTNYLKHRQLMSAH